MNEGCTVPVCWPFRVVVLVQGVEHGLTIRQWKFDLPNMGLNVRNPQLSQQCITSIICPCNVGKAIRHCAYKMGVLQHSNLFVAAQY